MPIVRTYACEDCMHMMDVTLSMDQIDDPAPECPMCAQRSMRQEFRPVALSGSATGRAHALAEEIASSDYHVSDMTVGRKEGDRTKVRYKDTTANVPASTWSAAQETLQQAVAAGRQSRLKYGNGLDVLQANLKSGAEPDLIEASKRRMIKLW
jgi:putative FmdB family regulatory protein